MMRLGDDAVYCTLKSRDDDWNFALEFIFQGQWKDRDGMVIQNSAVGPAHAGSESCRG